MYKPEIMQKQPVSYWLESTPETDFPKLERDMEADVAVIGGGIAGITCAYLLTLEGLKVAVLDAGRILRATTGHTTAKLTSQHELIYDKLIMQAGEERAREYAEANESAIKWVFDVARRKGIDCDLSVQSAYAFTQTEENIAKIEKEIKAASRLGIEAGFADSIPFDIPIKGAVYFKKQAQFHPLKFLLPLAHEITEKGGRIYEGCRVVELEEKDKLSVVTENGSKVTAGKVIIASHYPFLNKEGFYFARIYVERSYTLGVRAKEKFPGGHVHQRGKPLTLAQEPAGGRRRADTRHR